ncbi:imm11 family protein [Archangium violaceum]|uniref:Immunity MXAN-0049 protein domain-containing protein n=1 Tax=Archangium violaceum Cb vi76 TaxID=1406225 RepID=A0A084SRW8_9BACT|nr:DUF1629 domain-containing protein [Archangium violaceum]KFA91203.1 hypothetical protein Q664_23685 [Archangium violaceum Cb vi76]
MYYLLKDDIRTVGRWHLSHPVDEHGEKVNPWQFTRSQWFESQETIHFPVKPDGLALEFTLDAFLTPVVHGRVVHLFERMGIQEVQFISIQVEGHSESYFILNTLRVIRCIDDARCEEVQYWKPEDGEPEKVGEYRLVAGLRIDPAMVEGARIFRPWGWPLALLLSEELKQALEAEHITGTRFVEV